MRYFNSLLGVDAHLEAWGVGADRITELDWWDTLRVPGTGIEITAAPSQHFSGRGIGTRNSTLWSSFAIRSERHSLFFSGDTGLSEEYRSIGEHLGPFDVVMLEVGAWHPSWGDMHLGPVNALQARDWLGGGMLLPVHWGTFCLAMHAWDEPAETLLARAGPAGAPLLMPRLGEAVEPARSPVPMPWWRGTEIGLPPKTARQPPLEIDPGRSRDLPWPLD